MDKDYRNYLVFMFTVVLALGIAGFVDKYFEDRKEIRQTEIKKLELQLKLKQK